MKKAHVLGGMVAIGMAVSAALAQQAPTTQPTQQQLVDKVNALQAEVDQLKGDQQAHDADMAAMTKQVVEDADRQSQLLDLDSGVTAGWNPAKQQFYIGTTDGNFYLHPIALFQARYIAAYHDGNNTVNDESGWVNGFEIRCA
jgi:hypothetical protein